MKVKTLVEVYGMEQKCIFCGATENLTVDHVIPRAKGGKNELSNYVILCSKCNPMKGPMGVEEFFKQIKQILDNAEDYGERETDIESTGGE